METPAKESETDVEEAIVERIRQSLTTTHLSLYGLNLVHHQTRGLPVDPDEPDQLMMIGGVAHDAPDARPLAYGLRSEVVAWTSYPAGAARREMTRQWLVSVYAAWDEDLRLRLARARGVEAAQVIVPAFGDLRRFRHDVVHNGGIASTKYSTKTEVLTPFPEGAEIVFSTDRFADFLDALPWDVIPYSV